MKKSIIGSVLFVLILSTVIFGQGTSRITGVVKDTTGAIIPGATVTITHEGTNISSKMTSTSAGIYAFDGMQLGSYTLTVEMNGFKKLVSKGNILTLGVPLTVNAAMEAGAVNETVEVAGSYERVQTSTSGNFGTTLDNKTLTDLPLGLEASSGGRNPLNFIVLQPGVVSGSNTGGGIHVNGARDRAFNFTLDGIDINESSAGGSNFSPLRTNPDSLQEMTVITSNATADQGRNSGAQVMQVTKSGTNQYHGKLFYFHRNSALSANEWKNNLNKLPKPPLRQHQFGGEIGGPIFKNRTFFFFNTQVQRQVIPVLLTRTVYTSTARQGVFRYVRGGQNKAFGQTGAVVDGSGNTLLSACTTATQTNCIATYNIVANDPQKIGIDPIIKSKVLDLLAAPNNFTVGDGLNTAGYTFNASRLDPQEDYVTKIDHKFSDAHNVFGRFSWGSQSTLNDTTNSGAPAFPGLPAKVNTTRTPRNLAVSHKWLMNSNLINEFAVGLNRFTFNFINPSAGENPYSLVTILPTDPLDFTAGNLRTINTYQFVDNMTWTRGVHTFKGGINFRYQQHRDIRGSLAGENSNPIVTLGGGVSDACLSGGSGIEGRVEQFCLPVVDTQINTLDRTRLQNSINDLLGRVTKITQGYVAKDDLSGFQQGGSFFTNDARYGEYDFYFQDSWKLRTNLTVDLGLRYEAKLTPRAPARLFHPDQPVRVGEASTNSLKWIEGNLYDSDLTNFLPSIGFAWDPFGKGKTVFRANYRLAADRINTFVLSNAVYNNIPGLTYQVINLDYGLTGGPNSYRGRLSNGVPSVAPPSSVLPSNATQPNAFGVGSITVVDPDFRTPLTNQWGLSIQHDLGRNLVVDVSYIGRRAAGLFSAYNANQVNIFKNIDGFNTSFLNEFNKVKASNSYVSPLFNQLFGVHSDKRATENGTQFVRRNFASAINLNNVGAIATHAADRIEIQSGKPLLSLAGLPTNTFRLYPQFGSVNVIDSNDYSTYHALQVTATRKFSKGLTFQGSYTFGKSLDTRSYDPAFTVVSGGNAQSAGGTPFDINQRALNYARSDFDRAHVFTGYTTWDLPFGENGWIGSSASSFVQRFIEGWNVNGYFTFQSGRPFTIFSGSFQYANIVNSTVNCNDCSNSMGELNRSASNFGGFAGYFTPEEIAKFSAPAAGELGNTGRNFFTGPGAVDINMGILKRTKISEGKEFELRFEFFNVLNNANFGFPTAIYTDTTLGRIRDNTVGESRKIRIGAKINF